MQNRKLLALAAIAGLASVPAASQAAVTLTFTWEVSTNGGSSYSPVTGPISIAKGAEDYFGVLVNTGTTSPNAAASGGYSTGTHVQPAFLGLTSFGLGFNNSNGAATSADPTHTDPSGSDTVQGNTDLAGGTDPGPFGSNYGQGTTDGNGGISQSSISGSFTAATASVSTTAKAAGNVGWGGNAPAEVFRDLGIIGGNSSGTSNYSASVLSTSFNYTINNTVGTTGNATANQSTYAQSVSGYTLSFATLSVVNTAGTSAQPIISLTAGTTVPTTYSTQDGSIVMVGNHTAGYVVTAATPGPTAAAPATTGFVAVTNFTAGDTEIYALKLASNGTAIATNNTTSISAIIGDINASAPNTANNIASVGVTASAVTGIYTSLFPGYDILLTSTTAAAAQGSAELGFDFSTGGEQDTTVPNITVTGIAAVPEPATAAGVVLGAAGLLLGRRRKQVLLA